MRQADLATTERLKEVEAWPGLEPGYTDLQSAA
jgi:hypothetical protein